MRRGDAAFIWVGVAVALIVLTAVVAVPFLVTFDGYYYLSGSEVLFTKDAPDNFWWLREPGYSVLLRGIRGIFGTSDIWITLTQTFMIVIGGIASAVAVWMSRRAKSPVPATFLASALLLGVGNAAVLLYSSAALQQACLVISLGAIVYLATRLSASPGWGTWVCTAVTVILTAQLQEEFARLMAIPLGVAAWLAVGRSSDSSRRTPPQQLLRRGAAVLGAFLACQLVVSLVLMPWDAYRSEQLQLRSDSAPVKFDDFPPLLDQVRAALAPVEPHPYSALSHLLAFVGVTGSTQFVSRHYERQIYIENRVNPALACGALEGMPAGFERVAGFADEALDTACRSQRAISFSVGYVHVSGILYPVLLIAGLLCAVVNVVRRRILVPSVTVVALTMIYSVMGFGADRYSVPLFPVAVAILLETIIATMSHLLGSRRSSPDAGVAEAEAGADHPDPLVGGSPALRG